MRILFGKRGLWLASLALAVIVAVVTISAATIRKSAQPRSLIVLPGARDVHYSSYAGTKQVRYVLHEKYPGKSTIEEISDRLTKQGWKPLNEDFVSRQPSSHVTGWMYFIDESRDPKQVVQRWLAQWTNARGDIVNYCLDYRWRWPASDEPIDTKGLFTPKTDKLQVYGIYMPAKLAKSVIPRDQK